MRLIRLQPSQNTQNRLNSDRRFSPSRRIGQSAPAATQRASVLNSEHNRSLTGWRKFIHPLCRFSDALRTGTAIIVALLASTSAGTGLAQDKPIISVVMDSPFLHQTPNDRGDEVHWLAVFVTVTNGTDKELRIAPADWQLHDSQGTHRPSPITDAFDWLNVVDRDQKTSLTTLQPRELVVASSASERCGLFFLPLSITRRQPDLKLTLTVDGKQLASLDLEQLATDQLQIDSRRMGPGRAVALLTLDGELNSLNAHRLVRRLEELVDNDRVARFVIQLQSTLAVPDADAMTWLRQLAEMAGRGDHHSGRFPPVPADVVALQLTQSVGNSPGKPPRGSLQADNYRKVHASPADAIDAAIAPLCERLPRELLLRELRDGESLSQRAVLRHGGERLRNDDLPLILNFIQSRDQPLKLAAFTALRHFNSQLAIDTLTNAVRSPDAGTSSAALTAIVTSRYGAVRAMLPGLLQSADDDVRARAAQALGRFPHSDWAPQLFDLASDSSPEIKRLALSGLIAIGHPQLDRLLQSSLDSDNTQLRRLALRHLMRSRHSEHERLATQAVLVELQSAPPSPAITRFLQRTRDARAVPLLRRWLNDGMPANRRQAVRALLACGDQSVVEERAADFDSLNTDSRGAVLTALSDSNSPRFWTLVPQALRSDRARLLDVASELLRRDGTRQAVELLAQRLADEDFAATRHVLTVCQSLAAIATPAARDVLIRSASSEEATLRASASAALEQLYARSPAMPFVVQGIQDMQRDNPDAALLHFNLAIQADPEHPGARSARADVALKDPDPTTAELEAARDDLRIAVRFDPTSAFALTCLALTEVRLDATDTGIRLVEDRRKQFADDAMYYYNTACIYGRAIEALQSREKSPTPDPKQVTGTIARYRSQALDDLQAAVDSGLDKYNLDWMHRDPDLATIRQSPEFEKRFGTIELPDVPDGLQ
ncbi:MAG: HEAT repeat domain-containing protein [Planctomycetota bacterium]